MNRVRHGDRAAPLRIAHRGVDATDTPRPNPASIRQDSIAGFLPDTSEPRPPRGPGSLDRALPAKPWVRMRGRQWLAAVLVGESGHNTVTMRPERGHYAAKEELGHAE